MALKRIFLDEKLVIDKYNSGLSLQKIANEFNVARGTITKILILRGIIKREHKNNNDQDIITAYNKNKSISKTSKELKKCENVVKRCLIKNGIIKYENDKVDVQEAVKLFNCGESVENIAKKFNVCKDVMGFVFASNGIKRDFILTDDEKNSILEKYKNKISIRVISKEFGVSRGLIQDILKSFGLNLKRKYSYDESFFERDTPESFYFAGFIAADGCVYKRKYNNILSIGIKASDREILDNFKRCLNYTGPVHVGKGKASIQISSKKICDDLERFGVSQRKSFTYSIPEYIKTHKYINHFIRGLIDGDGWVFVDKQHKFVIGLCGSFDCITGFKEVILKNCSISSNIHPIKSIWGIDFIGEKAKIIRTFIYNNSNDLYLTRKFTAAFSKNIRTFKDKCKPVIATNIITKEQVSFKSVKDAVRHGFHSAGIIGVCVGKYSQHKGFTWKYADKI